MPELIKSYRVVDHDTDVIQSSDTGRFFLRQYQHVPPHNVRDSVDRWDTRRKAVEAHEAGGIVWEGWA